MGAAETDWSDARKMTRDRKATMAATGAVNLVVALAPEARPILEHFHLRQVPGTSPFPVFEGERSDGRALRLVRSGPGKIAAAAAVAHLHGRFGMPRHDAWLNVGIAGHNALELGTVRAASRVVDVDDVTGRVFYPQRVFPAPCALSEVRTVNEPEVDYPDPVVYEMEAAGFCATATRFSTAELIHVLKVISDNSRSSTNTVTKERVLHLIGGALDIIEAWIVALEKISAELTAIHRGPRELPVFLERWRFSTTQRRQLEDLLRRWQLLLPERSAMSVVTESESSRAVLGSLDAELEGLVP